MKKNLVIFFVLISLSGFCDDLIGIRVFAHLKIVSVSFMVDSSGYTLSADGKLLVKTKGETFFKFTAMNDSIEVKSFDKYYGKFKHIKINAENALGQLRLKLINPDRKVRFYRDNFVISLDGGFLKLLNDVNLDNYIAGVVEAESGTRSTPEFYKVQAILARTFVLAHINKHLPEGYSLCDQVHCQAYYGMPKDMSILKAVADTRGKVVVDENLNLIVAAFHSNSGGQTANSEDVWGARTSYLKSVKDTFSTRMPNFNWERRMTTDDWLSYLKLKHNYPIDNPAAKLTALNFRQETRKIYLEASNVKVPLKNVRTDLQLKSTFFSIYNVGDTVVFIGKGYGHSLGMSQEGAMRMTKLGYSYMDVLNFYYRNIQIIDMRKLSFFRDE